MGELDPDAGGTWQITTQTAQYLIDLDNHRLQRDPLAGPAMTPADGAVMIERRHFDTDGDWQPLLKLIHCRVGDPLIALLMLNGQPAPIVSTEVATISHAATSPTTTLRNASQRVAGPPRDAALEAEALTRALEQTGNTTDDDSDYYEFTDFARHKPGSLDQRVLLQDVYWVDINAQPHFLIDMSPEYIDNVLLLLYAHADEWHTDLYDLTISYVIHRKLNPQAADDGPGLEAAIRMVGELRTIHPLAWVNRLPLTRKLLELRSRD